MLLNLLLPVLSFEFQPHFLYYFVVLSLCVKSFALPPFVLFLSCYLLDLFAPAGFDPHVFKKPASLLISNKLKWTWFHRGITSHYSALQTALTPCTSSPRLDEGCWQAVEVCVWLESIGATKCHGVGWGVGVGGGGGLLTLGWMSCITCASQCDLQRQMCRNLMT